MIEKRLDLRELWDRITNDDDTKAFERLFFILNTKLIKFCELYVKQKEAAEEIVADVFVNIWSSRKELLHVRNPQTYIFICVKNRALNYLKKAGSFAIVHLDDSLMELTAAGNPQDELEKKELFFQLDQAIDSLPQQCKVVFQLVKEEGMKYKEVSEILNISHKTVQAQIFRAMKKLSKEMSPYLSARNFISKFL
ncbi:RNA polymerase sigma-70 factor [Pedobacter sp. AW31-3R]|uniref:RNA polymerase sigma-70 factor n=1 Tax=Pedobacter sp. AW31-3R TaxID=3445781 RepID=UPI003F9FAEAB